MTLELSQKDDLYFDYCQYPYKPKKAIGTAIRSVNLLFHSFDAQDCPAHYYDFVTALQKRFGRFETIFGIKLIDGKLAWEYYLYNWGKKKKDKDITSLLGMEDWFHSEIKINENTPYFMFSIDINDNLLLNKRLENINVYTGHSYFLSKNGFSLQNFYKFYLPEDGMDDVKKDILTSVFVDFSKIKLRKVLLPELARCKSICRARKKNCDSLYFSRIRVWQLLWFLEHFSYPLEIINWVESHQYELYHLRFDVGYDYKMEGDKLKIIKSGYYGYF